MKISTEAREDHQMKVVAEFEDSALEKYKHQAARKISQKRSIPGFRPGKAPYDVILRLFGNESIEEEAIEIMVEDIYPQMLTEAKINPAAPGTLEDISKKDPLKFSFIVPLEPTVDLAGYKDVRKKYSLKPVSSKQVDEYVERLKKNYATAEPVERPAQKGDLVYLKVDANLLNPKEGENSELLKDSPLQVVIGDNDSEENDFPYKGFGDNLLKLSANEEKSFKYTYPSDSKYEKLRDQEVEFHVNVQSVKSLHLPEFDDAFAQTVGNFENVEKLRDSIKEQIENHEKADYDAVYFDELLDKVVEQSKIKYPPQVLDHEIEHMVESVEEDLSKQHMELETYLKTIKKDKSTWLDEEIKPAAKKRLEQSLIVEELSKIENIKINNEDLQSEVTHMISEMQGSMDMKKLEKQLKNERVSNAFALQAASRVMNRMVLERLKDIATGKKEEVPVEIVNNEDKAEVKVKSSSKKKNADSVETIAEPVAKPKKSTKKSSEDNA